MTGSVNASFSYDALGRRVSKTINGTRTDYQYDGRDIVAEIGNGTAINATYIRSRNVDEPFARITSSGVEYYHADVHGSVLELTNAQGVTTASYTYDPFGNTTQTGISSNPFQYSGRENDGTGLYYYRARYYLPALQRFISEDPAGLRGGVNRYLFVMNTPINLLDLNGKGAIWDGITHALTPSGPYEMAGDIAGGVFGTAIGTSIGSSVGMDIGFSVGGALGLEPALLEV